MRFVFWNAHEVSSIKHQILILMFMVAGIVCSCRENHKGSSEAKNAGDTPPNIVLFLVDDLGWQDFSLAMHSIPGKNSHLYRTPHIEKLAQAGMVFTDAYASHVCSPTRVSIITGMNPVRHRVTNWTLRKDQATDREDPVLTFPAWNVNGVTPVDTVSRAIYAKVLPQILKESGYTTIHAGKAHWGALGTPGENPLHLGFDYNIAGHAAGAPASYWGEEDFGNHTESVWAVPGLSEFHGKDIFLTEALTRKTLDLLDTLPRTQPFFLHMSHYAVHIPLYADHRFYQDYLVAGLDSTEAKYASMIEGVDKSLGDIMDFLDRNNIRDNTLVIFMSDNGGLSASARGGERHTHNAPLKSGKGSFYEGGIRVPLLVSWPGTIAAGKRNRTKTMAEDIFSTLIDIVDYQKKLPQTVDGQSLIPAMKQEPSNDERIMVWHYPNKWGASGPGIGTGSAIRKGDWKLITFYKDSTMELYNIENDIREEKNLLEEKPVIAQNLAEILSQYLQENKAQLPLNKNDNRSVGYPSEW